MSKSSQELTAELQKKIGSIKLNQAAGIFGTTSSSSILQDMQKAMAGFSSSLAKDKDYEVVMKNYEVLAGSVDTAAITGIFGESEMDEYYRLIDDIWIAIERERIEDN